MAVPNTVADDLMKSVLIVDDHAGMRKALRSLLLSHGFEVCGEAVDGMDAIRQAQVCHPDLILLDLSMPVMNGLAAARELTKIMPEVPLLMVTNHVGSVLEEEALRAGVRRVMSKNESLEGLMSQAHQLVD